VLEQSHQLIREHGLRGYTITPPCNALALAYLVAAEQAVGFDRLSWMRKARRACRAALKQGKAFCGGMPEAMRLQGRYAWLKGRRRAAQRWWQRSLVLAETLGARYHLAMTHLEIGERLGDRAHLERAEALLVETGTQEDLARAQELLAQYAQT